MQSMHSCTLHGARRLNGKHACSGKQYVDRTAVTTLELQCSEFVFVPAHATKVAQAAARSDIALACIFLVVSMSNQVVRQGWKRQIGGRPLAAASSGSSVAKVRMHVLAPKLRSVALRLAGRLRGAARVACARNYCTG